MPLGPNAHRPPDRMVVAVESVVPGLIRDVVTDARGVLGLWPQTVITSWWRSAEHNARVGGAEHSQHRVGLALDFVPPRHQWAAVARWLRDAKWVVIDEGDHLHAQTFRASSNVQRFVGWASRYV